MKTKEFIERQHRLLTVFCMPECLNIEIEWNWLNSKSMIEYKQWMRVDFSPGCLNLTGGIWFISSIFAAIQNKNVIKNCFPMGSVSPPQQRHHHIDRLSSSSFDVRIDDRFSCNILIKCRIILVMNIIVLLFNALVVVAFYFFCTLSVYIMRS